MTNPLYQLHLLVDIPQDETELQTHPQRFTEINYIVAYGIIENINADKVYDYHTGYETEPTKMKMIVKLYMGEGT